MAYLIKSMLRSSRIAATTAAIFVVATSLMLGVAGGGAPTLRSSCHDPMVYDPNIDEIIPAYMVQGLESAVPPVQPGDKLTFTCVPGRCSVSCAKSRSSDRDARAFPQRLCAWRLWWLSSTKRHERDGVFRRLGHLPAPPTHNRRRRHAGGRF